MNILSLTVFLSYCNSASHHTLVLGSSGQLWAFGSGVKGQLGTGITEGCLRPTSVLLERASGGAATVIHNGTRYNVYFIVFYSLLYLILFNYIMQLHTDYDVFG